MTYQETLDFLFSQLPMYQKEGKTAYKADIGNIVTLCEVLGNPHQRFKSIHVAGTNGKGSVSNFLTSVLIEAGYKVGTYTSPHYLDFRERIKINGQYVSQQFVIDFVEQIREEVTTIYPSFFEITVAMAFQYFAMQEVDVAVVEVGLGGRLDSTNIITPELSIITNISFDHQQFLGNTLEQIAGEKAGIIKQGVPVVIGKTQLETTSVFKRIAKEKNAPITFADQLVEVKRKDENLTIENNKDAEIVIGANVGGAYQLENLATAFVSFHCLKEKFNLTDEHLKKGIEQLQKNSPILGRWQVLGKQPLTIADSCHNEAGIQSFVEEIKTVNQGKLHLIYGAVSDKDVSKITKLLPRQASYYLTEPTVPRKMPVDQLRSSFESFPNVNSYKTIAEAIQAAKKEASAEDTIAIFGSIFLIADLLKMVNSV